MLLGGIRDQPGQAAESDLLSKALEDALSPEQGWRSCQPLGLNAGVPWEYPVHKG